MSGAGPVRPPGRVKSRIFALLAATVVPVLLLGALEGILRLAGVGFAPGFFREAEIAGEPVLTDNPHFGWRFFPPAVARGGQPFVIPRERPPDGFRIFVLGGSAALGDPAPAYGIPRQLQALLEAARPDLRCEVVNAAMTAINSHVVLPIAADCVERDADLLVIYLGNNEVVGPFGAGSVFGRPGAGLRLSRALVRVKATRLGQLLDRLLGATLRRGGEPQAWRGMELFLGSEIPLVDPALPLVHETFRRNLADICRTATERGIPVVLSTVGTNLRHCAPFASVHAADLPAAALARWREIYDEGIALEAAGRLEAARERYREASREVAGIDAGFAELTFRLARCADRRGDRAEARAGYVGARELDALRFRADAGIDAAIRAVAAAGRDEGVHLVDAAAALAAASPDSIPGWELFDDHVHLNFAGSHLVASELGRAILPLLPGAPAGAGDATGESAAGALPSPEACARRLGHAPWARHRVLETMRQRRRNPPFVGQVDAAAWEERIAAALDSLKTYTRPHYLRRALAERREVLAEHPEDWELRRGLAELLGRLEDRAGALAERRRLADRFPHSPDARYGLGTALEDVGRAEEALREHRAAVALFPGHYLAHAACARLLRERGEVGAAIRHYREAVRRNPEFGTAWRDLGGTLLDRDDPAGAEEALRRALEVNPDLAAAHKLLGDALARQGRPEAAERAYRDALAIHPAYVAVHTALGDLALAGGRAAAAITHYENALRLRAGTDAEEIRRKLAEARARAGGRAGD